MGPKVKNIQDLEPHSTSSPARRQETGGPHVNLAEGPTLTPNEIGGWGVVRGVGFGDLDARGPRAESGGERYNRLSQGQSYNITDPFCSKGSAPASNRSRFPHR